MNTILYHADGSTRVVHRIIPSDYIQSVAHDYRASLVPLRTSPEPPPTKEEQIKQRLKVLTAKADHKKHRGTKDHNEQRDDFISAFLKSKLPNWGSVKFSV